MDPTAAAAQRAAIMDVRGRYERGELSLEAFRRALDALVLAETPEECQVILREVQAAAHPLPAVLAALESGAATAVQATDAATGEPAPEYDAISAILGNTRKMQRPWRLAEHTRATAVAGDLKLDLRRASVPRCATIEVQAVLGSVTIYVPRAMRVLVETSVILGDVIALGEHVSGIVASSHEEHTPESGEAAAELVVFVRAIGANVKVVLVDRSVVSLGEVVRQALRAIAEGVSRGLQGRYEQGYGRR
jgi:hypothetical protein